MARLSEHGIRLSSMSPSFLNSNSTSHTWPFSAVAELIDNASDPGVTAKQIWIDVVEVEGHLCLTFTDNGSGMTPNKLHKMLSFGLTEKGSGKGSHQAIGVYGNGFKSGSMRLGRDALIFTRNGGCQTVGMLSQSYLQAIRAQAVIVPMVPFNQQTKSLVVTEDSEASLKAILEYSLFSSQEQLLHHFDTIPGKKGTKILIWNIRRNKDGKPELDFETDEFDIRMPDVQPEDLKKGKRNFPGPQRSDQNIPEMDYSLRAYLSILYLKPRTQIILRQKKVPTKLVAKSLSHIENDVYKPQFNKERVKVSFGFNRQNKDHYGIMMYHKNRLIKSYEKVGFQIKLSGQRAGVGVIGVIECNFLKPAHNKQDFEYTKEYRLTLLALGLKLNDYWKEITDKKAREREFKALQRKCTASDTEEEVEKEDSPAFLQCEECLKWRRVPKHHYTSAPEHWNCSLNPNPRHRSCIWPEEVEESEEDLIPKYHKHQKKTEEAHSRKRGRSLETRESKRHLLSRGLSEPLTTPLIEPDHQTPKHTDQHTETGSKDAKEEEENKNEGEEDTAGHSSSDKRKVTWPPSYLDKRSCSRAESQQVSEATGEELHPAKDASENQTLAEIGKPKGERAHATRVGTAQTTSSQAWIHSLPPAQTVVVSPLSRPEGPWSRSTSLEGGDKEGMVKRLAALEKESQRLRQALGLAPMPEPDATPTTSPTGEKPSSRPKEPEEAPGPGKEDVQDIEDAETRRPRQADNGGCSHKEASALQEDLMKLRRNIVALLSAILPHVDLQGISLERGDVDGVLQQIIDANSLHT
ncbi:MORC family CW-type zinc finger protein 3 isoform X1 [Osmerus mordax]|uniref:MORC family CW-type zinc finger protein 3 isoform X1 n=1 Tax=Osmerus mordax TaxID=8014 RepID=UPI003510980C